MAPPSSLEAKDKIPVATIDDLPRHTYPVKGSLTEFFRSDAQFGELARQVETDLQPGAAKSD